GHRNKVDTVPLFRCLRGPTVWAINRSSHWWDVLVPGFTDSQWLQNFRMSEDTINYLCVRLCHVLERTDTTFQKCVPLKKRLAIALWKLATGSEYRSIGHLFGVSLTTVCRCVQEFCAAMQTVLVPELIKIPSAERFEEMAAYFENCWGLPHCVGAIDGSHIPIIAPTTYHSDFFNQKGWHSLILQGVVDGWGLFWNICVGMPGSLHDARVLRLSSLWELATHGNLFPLHTKEIGTVKVGYYIIGDSAYSLQDWLMKPFPDTVQLTHAFGRLKGRWPCLLQKNECDMELAKVMVTTCCALHNLCENHSEIYDNTWDVSAAEYNPAEAVPRCSDGRTSVRDALVQLLQDNELVF
uniref:DDE Tnp4 domain-containing protein n=1 Tax=Poecilia reticulata TaxID=8081 RepID=A0A3P9P2V7_POERE